MYSSIMGSVLLVCFSTGVILLKHTVDTAPEDKIFKCLIGTKVTLVFDNTIGEPDTITCSYPSQHKEIFTYTKEDKGKFPPQGGLEGRGEYSFSKAQSLSISINPCEIGDKGVINCQFAKTTGTQEVHRQEVTLQSYSKVKLTNTTEPSAHRGPNGYSTVYQFRDGAVRVELKTNCSYPPVSLQLSVNGTKTNQKTKQSMKGCESWPHYETANISYNLLHLQGTTKIEFEIEHPYVELQREIIYIKFKDPCKKQTTCHHGGTCEAKSENRSYSCQCVPGWTGQYCETVSPGGSSVSIPHSGQIGIAVACTSLVGIILGIILGCYFGLRYQEKINGILPERLRNCITANKAREERSTGDEGHLSGGDKSAAKDESRSGADEPTGTGGNRSAESESTKEGKNQHGESAVQGGDTAVKESKANDPLLENK